MESSIFTNTLSLRSCCRKAAGLLTILWVMAFVFQPTSVNAQAPGKLLESVTATVTQVGFNYWCADGIDDGCFIGLGCSAGLIGIVGGGADHRYKLQYSTIETDGTPSAPQNNSVFPIKYDDQGGTGECGAGNAYTDTKTRNDVNLMVDRCATAVRVIWDAWEEDGCGGDDDYNTGCGNDDERRTTGSADIPVDTYVNGSNTQTVINAQGYTANVTINWDMADAPIVATDAVTLCTGNFTSFNITSSPTAGGQFSMLTDFNDITTQVDSRSDAGILETPVLNVAGNYTYYIIEKNSTNQQANFCRGLVRTVTVEVLDGNVVNPALDIATPAVGSTVCPSATVSATITAGSGGGTCSDVIEFSTDAGTTWSPYTSGASITPTQTGGGAIQVRVVRDCSSGGCGETTPQIVSYWNVLDNLPTAVCTDVTIDLDATGNAIVTAGQVDGGTTDDCGLASIAVSPSAFTCTEIGVNVVTLTATDDSGNTSTCSANVTVEDPLLACGTGCVTQDIDINIGWNIISSYILPDDPDFDVIISDIASDLILIKNGAGQVVLPGFFNQIGNWDPLQGYQVKAAANTTLTMQCTQIDPAVTPISLASGWSIVSYLRDTPMDADVAWAGISSNITLAKNNAGQVYLPGFFNQIGDLQPGQGYQIKMSAASVLTYPANARVSGSATGTYTPQRDAERYMLDRNTGNNATIIIPESSIKGLQRGDEIGVFNRRGELTGSGVYDGTHVAFAVWGNDLATGDLNNMAEGESFEFRIYRPSLDEEFSAQVEISEGNTAYTTNGISVLRSLTIDKAFDASFLTVYPNPAREQLNFDIRLTDDTDVYLSVYDVTGRDVMVKDLGTMVKGNSVVAIDIAELAAGKYFYTVDTNEETFNGSFIKVAQ